jgi:two-component system, OmpR family, sensor histidine kinase TorS
LKQPALHARQGTGLGLAICKSYANLLGASLTVQSTERKGSVFTLALRVGSEETRSLP